ncbi:MULTISPECIES: helix-turn-helix transcriptional regulator [unclassified Enterococcus]|uniref:helix-turn-helix domain-containing protein n=1 Tax=unclassified Enterococcus TaxID=2608891 RepID=UPI001552B3F1|nr:MULTISPECIES: helix-turn-helix transcriptional regulator [unclassified Enterococcus]MBS7577378.1 helix-turn-helix transcriptional regulator [Enterococcus sp. MMGLQ5-2]MBS7584785.1 helix-turn-helix transcriptional regulator [Enterococcus sp. MMGLQ5-1]NPD12640.1 helix-turn-helix transcriptional regulator [Enterococcus sp. MMGLQ5-1]NPD37212.1 helix-turn-helix transcriptional regulator [Enterococcus sp. MMGLQ5-2]
MILGEQIKLKRAEFNYTQQELAEKLYVSRQTISNWELARSYPDIENLILLSELFSVSIDSLLKEDVKVVESLKKKESYHILYGIALFVIGIAVVICLGIDFIMNHALSWSLIVAVAAFMAISILIIAKNTHRFKIIKCSLALSGLLFLLFAAISFAQSMSFINLCLIGTFWLIYYWVILLIFTFTKLPFWYWLAVVSGLSILVEGLTVITLQHSIIAFEFIVSNLIEVIVIFIFIFCGIRSVDNGRIDKWFSKIKLRNEGLN